MTKQEAIRYAKGMLKDGGNQRKQDFVSISIECIENLDILIDYIVEYDNQDIICDDLYGYDEVDGDCWCSRNCKNFNRECVITWLEWKRGDNND